MRAILCVKLSSGELFEKDIEFIDSSHQVGDIKEWHVGYGHMEKYEITEIKDEIATLVRIDDYWLNK